MRPSEMAALSGILLFSVVHRIRTGVFKRSKAEVSAAPAPPLRCGGVGCPSEAPAPGLRPKSGERILFYAGGMIR